MFELRLDADTEERLERLAVRSGHTKTFLLRAAFRAHLGDLEDFYLAEERMRDWRAHNTIPLADLKAELGFTN